MKRFSSMILALALCLSLTACQTAEPVATAPETVPQTTSPSSETVPPTEETAPAPTVWKPRIEEPPLDDCWDFDCIVEFDAEKFAKAPSGVDVDAKESRHKIATVEQAIAFLDERYPEVIMNGGYSATLDEHGKRVDFNYHGYDFGATFTGGNLSTGAGRSDIVNAMSWLLYDDMEIYTVLGLVHDDANQYPILSINCIKTDTGYRFVDPVQHMRADKMSRLHSVFPEAEVETIDQWLELALADPWIGECLKSLYFLEGGDKYAFSHASPSSGVWARLLYPEIEPVYRNDVTVETFATYVPSITFDYEAFQNMPYVSFRRDLTTQQLIDSAEAKRKEVSTLDQAIDCMIEGHSFTGDSMHCDEIVNVAGSFKLDYGFFCSGSEIVNTDAEKIGRCSLANAVTWLLCDDMDIRTVIGFHHRHDGGLAMYAANCIKTATGYVFFDAHKHLAKKIGQFTTLEALPEAEVSSIEDYVDLVLDDPTVKNELDYLYILEGGDRIAFTENAGNPNYYTLCYPQTQPVYTRTEPYQKDLKTNPGDIGLFRLSQLLGGTTLTPEEAYGLAGAEPEVVKEKVKTAADVLMYMLAVDMGDNGGCYCDQWGEYIWHTNYTARKSMRTCLGNCGTCANLANYLLEDDYEEIGFVLQAYYPGNGGGHVYNYIRYQGEYYIVDLSWYLFNKYDPNRDYPVPKVHTLAEFGPEADSLYGSVCLVLAHTGKRHLPNVFGEDFEDFSNCHYYLPMGSSYTVLYEAEDGYHIGELPFDKKYYDWEAWE